MGKLVDAEITLKYSNGQLTIASRPNVPSSGPTTRT